MVRHDGRTANELRPVTFDLDVQPSPAGSCIVTFGSTRVLCSVSIEEGAPRWRSRQGWLTAEYSMLPGATSDRSRRDRHGPSGRSKEIERLIGRSLRAAVDVDRLGDVTITVDCDVLVADGGTRCASITGGWVALASAMRRNNMAGALIRQVAAVSVGVVGGETLLDLPYVEDAEADVDANVVMTDKGAFIEAQATAEGRPFLPRQFDEMLTLAKDGCAELVAQQAKVLAEAGVGA